MTNEERRTSYQEWIALLLGVVTLLFPGLGIMFTAGYFHIVGQQFLSAFSLSEHLVFSIRGLPISLTILALFGMLVSFQAMYQRGKERGVATRYIVIEIGSVILTLVLGGAVAVYSRGSIRIADFLTVENALVAFTLIILFYFLITLYSGRVRYKSLRIAMLAFGLLSTSLMIGGAAAQFDISVAKSMPRAIAVLEDGSEAPLVRFGESRSLLMMAKEVLTIVPTSQILQVKRVEQ